MATLRLLLLLIAFAIWCWLSMMLTHELGHVAAARFTGGTLTYVNVYPGQLSSTLVQPNPRPSIVLWCGIWSGWLLPQAIAWLLAKNKRMHAPAHFWAGFCWLTGGVYLAAGGLERLTDTGELVKAGWPLWLLVVTGCAAALFGYATCRKYAPLLIRLHSEPAPSTKATATAWLALTLWIACQWCLAEWLSTTVAAKIVE